MSCCGLPRLIHYLSKGGAVVHPAFMAPQGSPGQRKKRSAFAPMPVLYEFRVNFYFPESMLTNACVPISDGGMVAAAAACCFCRQQAGICPLPSNSCRNISWLLQRKLPQHKLVAATLVGCRNICWLLQSKSCSRHKIVMYRESAL